MASVQRRITAKSLGQRAVKKNIIKGHVNEIVKAFEHDAMTAAENHLLSCTMKVPKVFDIPGMSNKKAQLCIYVALIRELEDREFKVEIDFETGEWEISGWEFDIDDVLEQELMNEIIARVKKQRLKLKQKPNH